MTVVPKEPFSLRPEGAVPLRGYIRALLKRQMKHNITLLSQNIRGPYN